MLNEAETRADLIDPALKAAGWGVVEASAIRREFLISPGRIDPAHKRKPDIADYVLLYRDHKLAVIEAKASDKPPTEGVAQAKSYAAKLQTRFAYSTNGQSLYAIDMHTGAESEIPAFPTPDELWNITFATQNAWRHRFAAIPFEKVGGRTPHYYQEIAVQRVLEKVAANERRILLTLATGTGKTFIAFQIAWKLFHAKWNLTHRQNPPPEPAEGPPPEPAEGRRPRILFLADRNILADQAYNAFSAFDEDALVRIAPDEIRKKGKVPKNGAIFFTIFQTFMSGPPKDGHPSPYFGEYPPDFFDFIIIDECHRGGANDESTWRAILEYFAPATQLGLTATPKRNDNADTYKYFGEPVYTYSLKEGINDGFLTPFKVKQYATTLDEYVYTPDDQLVEGEVEARRRYVEKDFNRIIEIPERERYRVQLFLSQINPNEKTLVFCATQYHALIIRDAINQMKSVPDPNYCARVTADDGPLGEQALREFQDNEKTIPTILTTSQKLSTGVDARNVRNIVLLRPINSMIEFKQIIGRGTRLYDGKDFFTIYDFVKAHHHFQDPEWDGEPLDPEPKIERGPREPKDPPDPGPDPAPRPTKIKVKLANGKERTIQHMMSTTYWHPDGTPMSAEQFLTSLFGILPDLFKNEDELRKLWSLPETRKRLLERLADKGFGHEQLEEMQKIIDAENSDLYDVLAYVAYARPPETRTARAARARPLIFHTLNSNQQEFINFVLERYIHDGIDELDQEKLPTLLTQKYHALEDAQQTLGPVPTIRSTFIDFQHYLYLAPPP
ncbi:MAG TPA: DEAD/DEAH box helicase family protein [Phycisphaerae bacterium]|nr:DEAD/DEAH box helicase family protein [Phycisphaerae bacterium]